MTILFASVRANAAPALAEEAKLYFTAPLRWDAREWTYFGGTLLTVAAAHEYDDEVRAHFATDATVTADGRDAHSTRAWLPAAAMVGLTWAYATMIDDRAGYGEGRSMLAAAGFSAVSTVLLKTAAGRRRPSETAQVDDWFNGGGSFPSMHVSVTFAVGSVLAESGGEEFRWVRRALGYGLASAVAYSRVHDDVHWLSDAIAGAALGVATGGFVANRDEARRARYSLILMPTDGGAVLLYSLSLH